MKWYKRWSTRMGCKKEWVKRKPLHKTAYEQQKYHARPLVQQTDEEVSLPENIKKYLCKEMITTENYRTMPQN